MSNYKALISKKGEILSLSEEEEKTDQSSMHIAAGSKYPDAVFVNAADSKEAEQKIMEMLRKAEAEHLQQD